MPFPESAPPAMSAISPVCLKALRQFRIPFYARQSSVLHLSRVGGEGSRVLASPRPLRERSTPQASGEGFSLPEPSSWRERPSPHPLPEREREPASGASPRCASGERESGASNGAG